MSLRVSRGDLRALSGALTEISAGLSKIASLSRVPLRCICGHMWTLNSLHRVRKEYKLTVSDITAKILTVW